MEEKKKKKINPFSILGEILLWVLAIFCISVSIVNVIDTHTNYSCSYFGYRTSVIVSESMAYRNRENTYLDDSMHQIGKYDVIMAKDTSYDDIQVYDVVLHVESAGLVCHRVIDKYEDNGIQYLVTRGDSNNMDDAPFAYSLCRGKVVNVIPKIGEAVLFLQSGYFLLAAFFSIFLITSIFFAVSFIEKKEEEKKKLMAKEETIIDVESEPVSSLEERKVSSFKQTENKPIAKSYRIRYRKAAKVRRALLLRQRKRTKKCIRFRRIK